MILRGNYDTLDPRNFTHCGVKMSLLIDFQCYREIGQRATTVRSCYDITCSENAVEFLTELGCRMEFEYVAKGFVFRKGRMKVTVSKIHKIAQGPPPPNGGPPQEALEPMTGSYLVELSVLAPSGSDAVADDMKNFAEQLKPLVQMEKIDPRRQGV